MAISFAFQGPSLPAKELPLQKHHLGTPLISWRRVDHPPHPRVHFARRSRRTGRMHLSPPQRDGSVSSFAAALEGASSVSNAEGRGISAQGLTHKLNEMVCAFVVWMMALWIPSINHLPAAASADVPAQQQTFSQQDAPAADGETSVFMLSQVASSAAPSRVLEEVSELVQQHYWDPSLNGAADEWDGIVQKYRSKARDMDKRQSGAEDYRYYTLLQDMVNELDDRYSRVLAPPAAAEVLRAYDVLGVGIHFKSEMDGRRHQANQGGSASTWMGG
mmetsp:Transcript_40516/g.115490  ORF Transcript_40516/g.115490 Transcript_40516/m.115490 type:complete len:275 (-) Transcript_40516:1658-2482(-)